MNTGWAVLAGAVLIAASVLLIGRYQIAADKDTLYRMDRWTDELELCRVGGADPEGFIEHGLATGRAVFHCGMPKSRGGKPMP